MKPAKTARTLRASGPIAIAALAALMLSVMAPHVHASGSFGTAGTRETPVFCDMPAIKGAFSSTVSRYEASGVCVQVEAYSQSDTKSGRSEFADVNRSKELFRAAWTAQGSYDPQTKETWEKVTMPAPQIDQRTPVGRPYGTYETRMICATDPWLTGISVQCTGKAVSAKGNLGDMEAALRPLNRPVTTPNKQALLQALNANHDRYVRTHTFTSTTESKGNAHAMIFAPSIVEPKPGSTHRPQTAMSIRVAAAMNARDTNYILEIQQTSTPQNLGQANVEWHDLTNIPVTAAVAQSGPGYRGWGAHVDGTGPQMTASLGTYRVRAMATAPSKSAPSDWVDFKIAGTPGITMQDAARSSVDKVGGANAALKAAGSARALEAPRLQAHGAALPAGLSAAARPASPLAVGPSPLAKATQMATNKASAVSLNPQPLPPGGAPAVLPSQAPSTLR